MGCKMSGLDGLEMLAELHKHKGGGAIKELPPIIGATEHNELGVKEK